MIGIPDPTNGSQELAGRLQPYLRPGEELVSDLFVAIGSYLVAGRFITRWIGKRRTVYGITPDRVLVRSGSTFRDTPVKGGSMLVRRGLRGRHATIVFEPFGSYIASRMGP